MATAYNDIFLQEETEGIIERSNVSFQTFTKYNWIPHRSVFKSDEQEAVNAKALTYWSTSDTDLFLLKPNSILHPNVNEKKNSVKTDSGESSDIVPTFRVQLLDALTEEKNN